MTIKGLNKFILGKSSNVIHTIDPKEFENCSVAIDASIFMYKYLYAARKIVVSQTDIVSSPINEDDVFQIWIDYTLHFIDKWLKFSILPIFVFDGDAIKEKKKVIDKRKMSKVEMKEKIDMLTLQLDQNDSDNRQMILELKDLLIQYIDLTSEKRQLYKNIIQAYGIPCFDAVGEAEQLCTMMCLEKHVDAVCTTDIDVLAYGCPLMIKGFTDDDLLEVISLDKTLDNLKLTFNQFVDLCVMCGTDYNQNIKGLGPAKAYKLIKSYGSFNQIPIEAYQKLFKKMTLNELKMAIQNINYNDCCDLFKMINPLQLIVNGDLNNLQLHPMDLQYQDYFKN